MCWSNRRIYYLPYLDCLREIDAVTARLKSRGATEFVVAGHSLGANAALAYGAVNRGLKGIVALAPGHRPEVLSRRPQIAAGLATAREHVSKGRGNATASFPDVNGALLITVTATANAYLSFLAPDSPAVMPATQRGSRHPALYRSERRSVATRAGRIFAKAPSHPLSRYVTVDAGHFDTSAASAPAMVAWLKELAKN